ncbi:zinc ribbon domain-containing protein [Sorangium sp. So ce887]|uniref:zinc ribbon domain-containing protein n=1 Tax=Sorangium sp. So ce887 TaxID=3133324 RepID=UPI003F6454CB
MQELPCPACGHEIPASAERCPHCARPGLFPNVRAVTQPEETAAFDARFRDARDEASARGLLALFEEFMVALDDSKAVIARPLREAQRLASSHKEGYATYYQLTDAEVRLPDGNEWDFLRRQADEALFPGYKEKIRFAALTLDAVGLSNYGDCSMTLRTSMVAHRTTVLEENSAVFIKHRSVKMVDASICARGHRTTWDDRAKICAVKLGCELNPGTTRDQFPSLLLRQGATSDDDHFVEAHVYGPMTIRTFERVAVTRQGKRRSTKIILRALKADLAKCGVEFEVQK